ncbi:MAG TPA: hypothetical protein VJ922_04920 [Actinomycetota bacterium]|nr:hypothetical protein [Actinomycetota bacterium]
MFARPVRRSMAIAIAAASFGTLAPVTPAVAQGQIVCNAAAIVTIIPNPPGPGANQWSIVAKGSCAGDFQGTYMADVTGVGTSSTLGLCDGVDANPTMQDFELSMTVALTSTSTGLTKLLTETWSAPLTTFPITTPFLISDGGSMSDNDFVGAGNLLTHIFGNCPPGGTPSGQIAWARTL